MQAENSGVKCRSCRRTFASQNAVQGHMRIHSRSERQAARRDPGKGSAVAAPWLEDRKSAMERMDLLQGFGRTGKRWSFNKRRILVLAGPVAPRSLMEERQRADLLPRFARTGKRWSFKRREVLVAPMVGGPPLMEESRNMELSSIAGDGAIQARDENVCSICMRVFSSNLALGGHKAHHSMREKKLLATIGEEEDDDYWQTPPPQSRRRRAAVPQPCLRCRKIFSSEQALSAHERHCKEPPPPPPPEENQNNFARDFDLNELPPPEEGEM